MTIVGFEVRVLAFVGKSYLGCQSSHESWLISEEFKERSVKITTRPNCAKYSTINTVILASELSILVIWPESAF